MKFSGRGCHQQNLSSSPEQLSRSKFQTAYSDIEDRRKRRIRLNFFSIIVTVYPILHNFLSTHSYHFAKILLLPPYDTPCIKFLNYYDYEEIR